MQLRASTKSEILRILNFAAGGGVPVPKCTLSALYNRPGTPSCIIQDSGKSMFFGESLTLNFGSLQKKTKR